MEIKKASSSVDKLLSDKIHKQCMFEQVIAEDAGKRQATVSTKTRGEVRGGGRKPRPQKHSGRAQLGSTRASHCVGGGNAFGPRPNRNYKLYLNDQQGKLALKSAFSTKKDNLFVLEDSKIEKPSSKNFKKALKDNKIENKKVLVIVDNDDKNLLLSARNLNKVIAKKWDSVSTKDVLNSDIVVFSNGTIDKLINRLQ